MKNVWFISDTHFRHFNNLEYSKRPFTTISEHDDALIGNWNSVVRRGDMVYHLGDFGMGTPEQLYPIARRLNGEIHLILGNHDHRNLSGKYRDVFASVKDIRIVKNGSEQIVLCHYCMRVWPSKHHDAWHLFGHSHGQLKGIPEWEACFDVGVDSWNYTPVHYDVVRKEMTRRIKLRPEGVQLHHE